jgi:membrane-bound ClpP family serine protease
MATDQILIAAFVAAVAILVVVGIWRAMQRRNRDHEREFGAGGRTTVPVGSRGVAVGRLAPAGVVRAVGEEWSARSAGGTTIPEGAAVVVVDTDGLTLLVDPVTSPATGDSSAQG